MKLILASGSPRRREILEKCGYEFEVIPSQCEESVPSGISADDTVRGLAYEKALDVYSMYPDDIVLGADTVVSFDSQILGKPKDNGDAKRMLKMLSNQTHEVRTGFAILGKGMEIVSSELTLVTFNMLSEKTIDNYIATGEPSDKAGAYGIQGFGSVLVRSILGDYFNVVGLPVSRVAANLAALGIHGRVM